jgi:hypothetical protein
VLTWRQEEVSGGAQTSLREVSSEANDGKSWASLSGRCDQGGGRSSGRRGSRGAEACVWWAVLRPPSGEDEVWVRLALREWKILDKIATWFLRLE